MQSLDDFETANLKLCIEINDFKTSGNWVENRIECPKTGTFYFPPEERIDYEKLKPETRRNDYRSNKLNSSQVYTL